MSEVVLAVTDGCGNVVHFDVGEAVAIGPYDDVDGWVEVHGTVADSSPDEPWDAEFDELAPHGWYGHVETVEVEDV